MTHWFIADVDAYRGYLWKPCDKRRRSAAKLSSLTYTPARTTGPRVRTSRRSTPKRSGGRKPSPRTSSTRATRRPLRARSARAREKVNLLIDTSAVMMGGVERAAARADELEARLQVFEQDGRRNQEHDLEEEEDEGG